MNQKPQKRVSKVCHMINSGGYHEAAMQYWFYGNDIFNLVDVPGGGVYYPDVDYSEFQVEARNRFLLNHAVELLKATSDRHLQRLILIITIHISLCRS